ncbi:Glycosyl hydrolases family 2, TIM barrel domain [Flavobacteriaceae bacterium MAR_2010_188]|nr:Glycosyl hydrolases family 2, TIM barrel domain [Flavobacteriaceae bacterium MAR_2010_188]
MNSNLRASILSVFFVSFLFIGCKNDQKEPTDKPQEVAQSTTAERWSEEKANNWYKTQPWLRGANFNPSTAINQLEFWQEATFDPEAIDKELGWAQAIGLNCMRVYLHHVAWEVDKVGFKERIDTYLSIAYKHNIKTIFVFFDDCWNPTYQSGKQPEPKPGVHNSGWVRDPGDLLNKSDDLYPVLEAYVKDVLETFKNDDRIILWDLYNEPGNSGYDNKSLPLLKEVFAWARSVDPQQPLSSGVWKKSLETLNKFQVENSDIITYHNYNDEVEHQSTIDSLKTYNRPLICTEYMARKNNSRFSNIMPILKEQKIGAINWGLVAGKSNTKYAWDSPIPDGSEPELWFHEIFRKDGTPYKEDEVELIKKLTDNN